MHRILLILFLPVPLAASTSWILGAGNSSLASTPFATELHIANSSGVAANLQISLVPAGATTPPPPSAAIALDPGATMSYSDALNQLFGSTESSGAIRISADQPLSISASRHGASFGTDLPVIADEDLITGGNLGDALWVSESGDPASGFTTRFQVYLADANVTANLNIYDPAGDLVVTTPFTGGPGLFEVSTSSLISGPLPAGRAELRVSNGRAAGWVEVRDNITGDPMAMAFAGPGSDSASLMVNAVWSGTTPSGAQIRTDLRLFNPMPAATPVTVYDYAGHSASITLAPHSFQEIIDLAAFLHASAGGPLAVAIDSLSSNILAASRTAVVAQGGSPGILGEIHQTPPFDPANPPQVVSYVYGLPAGNSSGSIVARSYAGGAYQATLLDASGNVLSTPAPVSIPAFSVVQSALSDLLGNTTVPDGAQLQITVTTGSVEAALVKLSAGSDPSYSEAAQAPSAGCALPTIGNLSATQISLTGPGNVTVSWQTDLADSVDVSPAATGMPASGSLEVMVSQSTTFQVIAYNSCGQSSSPIAVTVGPPSPTLLTITTGASVGATDAAGNPTAQPGQLISIAVTNVADPATIDSAVFQAPDGTAQTVFPDSVDDSGNVNVRVPYWISSTATGGYVTGNVTVGITAGGAPVGALPLTIQPLASAGDPIAGFQAIIDAVAAASASFTGSLDPSLSRVVTTQQAYSAQYQAVFTQMLANVAANGSATLYWGAEPPGPNAVQVTITMADIANLVAYNSNLLATPGAASSSVRQETTPRILGFTHCLLAQLPYSIIPACKALKAGQSLGNQMQDYLSQFDSNEVLADARSQAQNAASNLLAKSAGGAALNKLKGWLRGLEILCLVEPITLQGFYVTPSKFIDNPLGSQSQRTGLFANMTSAISNQQIMANIEAYEVKQYEKKLGKSVTLNSVDTAALTAFLTTLLQNANSGFDSALTSIARSITGATPTSNPQIGACDLDHFYPKKNGPTNTWVKGNPLEEGFVSPQGDPDFFYIGRRPGPETFCIDPKTTNFLFPDDLELSFTKLNYSTTCRYHGSPVRVGVRPPKKPVVRAATSQTPADDSNAQFSEDVTIGDTMPAILIASDAVYAEYTDYDNEIAYGGESNYQSPNGAALFEPLPENRTESAGSTTSTVMATQTGPNSWTATLSTNYSFLPDPNYPMDIGSFSSGFTNIWLKATNPINRDNSQSLHVQMQPDGNCMGGFVSGASAQDLQGNQTITGCPAPMNCQNSDSPPNWTFDNVGLVQGNISFGINPGGHQQPGDMGGCTLTVSIQMTR